MKDVAEANLPVACSLTNPELQVRRREVLEKIRSKATAVSEVERGYRLGFPSDVDTIRELADLISLEHQCCPFLRFQLTVEPGEGPVWLELTGPPGTKDFLADLGLW